MKRTMLVAAALLTGLRHVSQRHGPALWGRTYTSTGFDMFRIEDGMLVEHWDAATKAPQPGP
jgi:predicted SnoaL-like aldol condensation-catalyzing enzyme